MAKNKSQNYNKIILLTLLLNQILLIQSQQTNVQLNLQENEYKEIDLTDYFNVITDSFYIQNNPNGIKIINPANILDKSTSSKEFNDAIVLCTFQKSQNTIIQASIKIHLDKSKDCTIFIDEISNNKREISIKSIKQFNAYIQDQNLNNLTIEGILTQSDTLIFLQSSPALTYIQKFIFDGNSLIITSFYSSIDITNMHYIRFYQFNSNSDYFLGIQSNILLIFQYTLNTGLIYLTNIPKLCGSSSQKINFINNQAYYLIKCMNDNGQLYFTAYQIVYSQYTITLLVAPQIISANSNLIDNVFPHESEIIQKINCINNELVYVLEVSKNLKSNTMILYKVKYGLYINKLNVETIIFDNVAFDTEIISAFIISKDLIAVITREYYLGFSTQNSKNLIFRIKQQPIQNQILIDVNQIFTTLLLTYEVNSNGLEDEQQEEVVNQNQENNNNFVQKLNNKRNLENTVLLYKTYQLGLNIPQIIIDLSQNQDNQIKFTVREQTNIFNQIVNFSIQRLNTDKITISLNQNQINQYLVVTQIQNEIQYKNIENTIIGSDLKLQLNDFTSDQISINNSKLTGLQIIKTNNPTDVKLENIVSIKTSYLEQIIIIQNVGSDLLFIYNKLQINQINENNELNLISLVSAIMVQTNLYIVDNIGIIYYSDKKENSRLYALFPVYSDENTTKLVLLTTFGTGIPQLTASDPINNYIIYTQGITLNIDRFQINTQLFTNPYYQGVISFQSQNVITYIYTNCLKMIVYYTDNQSIFAYDYNNRYNLNSIQLKTISDDELNRKVYLFSNTYIVIINYKNGEQELKLYSYDDFNYSQGKYLRSLQGLTYKLDTSNFDKIYVKTNINSNQEYIIIPGIDSNQVNVNIIFRLNEVSSQNQLYLSFQLNDQPFLLKNFIGTFSLKKQEFQIYQFSYFINLQMNYTINQDVFLDKYSFKTSSQISILNSNTNIQNYQNINYANINYNLQIQKSLQSQYGSINNSAQGLSKMLNVFTNQALFNGIVVEFDDTNIYKNNLLGWCISYSPNHLELNGHIQNRLILNDIEGQDAFDMIQIDQLIGRSITNTIVFDNQQIIELEQNLDYCYIHIDESSVVETQDDKTQTKNIDLTIYTICILNKQDNNINTNCQNNDSFKLCQNEDQQIQVLVKIDLNYTNQGNNNKPTINVKQQKSYNLIDDQYDRINKTLIKLINDPNLGFISAFQVQGQLSLQICQVILQENEQNTIQLDCKLDSDFKYLKLVQLIWFKSYNSIVFFTQDGLIYYGLNKTLSQFYNSNIKNLLYDLNENVDDNQLVNQVSYLNQYDKYISVLIQFDNDTMYQITFSIEQNILVLFKTLQYFTEQNYVFTGFATVQSIDSQDDKNSLIAAMTDILNPNNIVLFYYQQNIQPVVILNSEIYKIENILTWNRQIKLFFNKDRYFFMINRNNKQYNNLNEVQYQQKAKIFINSFNNVQNYNAIGFYITPNEVTPAPINTIPVKIMIKQSDNNNNKSSKLFYSCLILVILIQML